MTTAPVAPPPGRSIDQRHITLDADGIMLSARLAQPVHVPPRATVVALHGAGMSAGYFDGPAHPETSLLAVAAELGFTVVAIDRPGYGRSAGRSPTGKGSWRSPTPWPRRCAGWSGSTRRARASS